MTITTNLQDEFSRLISERMPNPRPLYHTLREAAPVFRTSEGFWYVTRYDLATQILRDDATWHVAPPSTATPDALAAEGSGLGGWRANPGGEAPVGFAREVMKRIVLRQDGENHRRLRRLVAHLFNAKASNAMEGRIADLIDRRLDRLGVATEFELIGDFAIDLPTRVILDICGLDAEHIETFMAVSESLIAIDEPGATDETMREADRVFRDAANIVVEGAADRRREPRDDLLTGLVRAEDEDDRLDEDELIAMMLFLVVAGHETTANTLGTGLYHLMRHPDQLELLRREPELMGSAVDELVRYEPAARNSVGRYPVRDVDLDGTLIRAGEKLYVGHQAANHDPAEFADPDRLDLRRSPNRHLGFGGGGHYCLGAALAKLELRLALQALLDRYTSIELAADDVVWRQSFIIRSLEALPLRVTPSG